MSEDRGEVQTQPTTQEKHRCKACKKTQFLYDKNGIHIKCNYCKTVTSLSWEEVSAMYHEALPQQKELFLFQTA